MYNTHKQYVNTLKWYIWSLRVERHPFKSFPLNGRLLILHTWIFTICKVIASALLPQGWVINILFSLDSFSAATNERKTTPRLILNFLAEVNILSSIKKTYYSIYLSLSCWEGTVRIQLKIVEVFSRYEGLARNSFCVPIVKLRLQCFNVAITLLTLEYVLCLLPRVVFLGRQTRLIFWHRLG